MLTSKELAAMQATQQAHMMDECVHMIYSSTEGVHGEPVASYTDGDTLACGIEQEPGKELQIGGETVRVDATFRLPIAAYDDIKQADQMRLTKRFGVALTTAETYEIIGLPARGPSGLVVDAKRIVV